MLLQAYCEYLERQDWPSLSRYLNLAYQTDYRSVLNKSSSFFEHYKNASLKGHIFQAKSNGSTGLKPSSYPIGPSFAIDVLTAIQRNRKDTIFLKHSAFLMSVGSFQMTRSDLWHNIKVDLTRPKGVDYTIQCLEHIKQESGLSDKCLEAAPIVFSLINGLINADDFYSFVSENNLRLISTGTDAFFKQPKVPVFDRMIDWKSGMNFYQCDLGGTHIAPCWHVEDNHMHDLINVANKQADPISNILEAEPVGKCDCGFLNYDMYFISHSNNCIRKGDHIYHDLDLINHLSEGIINIQFWQKSDDQVHVYLYGNMSEDDRSKIELFFNGLEVIYMPDAQFKIGTDKYPAFWGGRHKHGSHTTRNVIY